MSLPTPDRFVRYPDYEKFEKAFASAFPLPRTRAQKAQWTFKKKMAWRGWQMARRVPYVEPKCTLTTAAFKPLTPDALIELSGAVFGVPRKKP